MARKRRRIGWAWWDKGEVERILTQMFERRDQTTPELCAVLQKRLKLKGSRHSLNIKVLRWLRIIARQGWIEQRAELRKGPLGRPALVWGLKFGPKRG